ncbi:unnamed protein product, partial [Vitis vinifera]
MYLEGHEEEMPLTETLGLEGSMKNLNEKLAAVVDESKTKDDLVTKYARMAEEAIAGREKAEAEALSLKQELDEALNLGVAAKERLSHLDAALKQCMQQLTSLKEEQEQRIRDAVMKTLREFEKTQKNLEDNLTETSKRLTDLTVENTHLSKALLAKEKLIEDLCKIKSQADTEFKALMARLDSTEKENAFLKYEFRMLEKELEIRNEEREFNRRSAEAIHKQHLESVKKIAKLEAECQRLRLLVRKRLPGPAARLCEVEEENKTLKEILAKKNNELHSPRLLCARTPSRFGQPEAQLGESPKSQKTMDLVSYMSLMDDFVEMEKLAIVSADTHFQGSHDGSIGKSRDWLQDVLKVMLEQNCVSKRSLHELLDDIKIALGFVNDPSVVEADKAASSRHLGEPDSQPISGYITWKDEIKRHFESAKKDLEAKLQSATDNSQALMNQLEKSEQSIGSLRTELETLKDSKGLIEDQIENQKLINEELNTQLTVAKAKINEVLQKFSALEVEFEDKSNSCQELEATCLELQLQLESFPEKEVSEADQDQEGKQLQTGWEITAASVKLAECQETILNLGKQLKALASPRDRAIFDKVYSTTSTATNDKKLSHRSSLRDRMLADDDADTEVFKSPRCIS